MDSVRAKFRVVEVTQTEMNVKKGAGNYEPGMGMKIVLMPVYANGGENDRFYEATPSGKIELNVVKAEVGERFRVRQEFYVDFTPAE